MRKQILFNKDKDRFQLRLNQEVDIAINDTDLSNAQFLLWFKLFFYLTVFISAIILLYINPYGKNYIYL